MARKDTLAPYRAKRDFAKTAEPKGIPAKGKGFSYLIQKHEASHLHYDFRLELDGALKSWAVPKGPSLDPADKRLAMEVEDHPVAYGSFEGIIPKGEYGGGTVMLWDQGTWEPVGDPHKGLKDGKLVFKLHGKRLQGEWVLVRFHGRENKRNQWFLIKHRDEEARVGETEKFMQKNATSVVSKRTMEQIANGKSKVWSSKAKPEKKSEPVKKKLQAKTPNVKAKLPRFIPPQLATLSESVPKGTDWVHEIKFDGYRILAYIENGIARLVSRNDKDWTEALQPIADALATLPVKNAVIDGELIVMDAKHKSNFSDLKNALSLGDYSHMQYYAFDLLVENGEDIRALPLLERKARLEPIIAKVSAKTKAKIFYSEHFDDKGGKLLHGVCSMHLEGVISKRADGAYLSGRGKSWLKTKCIKREEFVIGGYTLPSTGGKGVGSLLLGYYDGDDLIYAGRVGTGWNNELSMKLRKLLDASVIEKSVYLSVTPEGRRKALWVKPKLVGEVEFTEWTPDGHLRHPSFQGLRDDKAAHDVVRDVALPVAVAVKEAEKEVTKKPKPKAVKEDNSAVTVGGIRISHPERVLYAKEDFTKQDLAEYYRSVADYILPHVANRPLSIIRCPEGTQKECFFQRHLGLGNSPYLFDVNVKVKGTNRPYMMIKNEQGLISLVQWGVIELHPWQCMSKQLDKPDRIIFDLDPDPSVTFERLIEGAKEIRARMKELGLESFLKTTGGKGLHVVVPLTPVYGWDTIKSFARAIAESMAHDEPDRYIATMSKAKRKGLIFVDYLRNDVTSTAVAPYSVRAREHPTVSTPLFWEELTPKLKLGDFTVYTLPARLKKKDPWKTYFNVKQKIPAKYLKALGIEPS